MIEFQRLNHVHIQASEDGKEAARWFYGELLGLKEVPLPLEFGSNPPVIWFRLLNFDLHVRFSAGITKPDLPQDLALNPPRHLCFEIKNCKETRKKLELACADTRDGYPFKDRDSFFVIDPFGNLIELIEFFKN